MPQHTYKMDSRVSVFILESRACASPSRHLLGYLRLIARHDASTLCFAPEVVAKQLGMNASNNLRTYPCKLSQIRTLPITSLVFRASNDSVVA